VSKNGKVLGWVTLAVNHDHLMSFTDHISPSEERYRDINSAYDGNYAFIWDQKGRNIVHPRHHSIVGYDSNGEPELPWLEDRVYEDFMRSGKSWREYQQTAPIFVDQLQSRKPAKELTAQGKVGLDCRWLNNAPQCIGWYNLADQGGSGSFLMLWSGLWKLTTAAAIPYYTGQYSPQVTGNKRGFGIVTIGVNLNDFHHASKLSSSNLDRIIKASNRKMTEQGGQTNDVLHDSHIRSLTQLSLSTFVLLVIVIVLAVWMASFLSKKIGWLNDGFNRYRLGENDFRFQYRFTNEITSLASTFNEMADTLNQNINSLEQEIADRTKAEQELRDIQDRLEILVEERTSELSETNKQLSEEIHIRRTAEEKAQYLAGHDPLTGLANRMLFNEQLQKAVSQCERSKQYGALLFLDLDRFKHINDTLGHPAGDAMLVHMANILQERVRKTDTAARLGGDEFAVIMTGVEKPEWASVLAQDILDKLQKPIVFSGNELTIKTSIGIATFHGSDEDKDPEKIIKNADMAMYIAKAKGGMHYQFFEPRIQEKLFISARLEKELRIALDKHQLIPFFQPLYHTTEHRTLYLEVLARWIHPENGLMESSSFIDAAVHSGLIGEIDAQIMQMACLISREWLMEGLFNGRVSFNISPQYLEQHNYAARVREILDAHQFSAQNVAFEISEYTLLQCSPQTFKTLSALREMGIEIIIDRLVVERAALGNLFDYPVDAIKIDHFFTSKIGDIKVNSLIATIATVARAMNLRVIAEGVENETQWEYFQTLHCNIIQGYKHARPLSADDTYAYFAKGSKAAG
jgi:diguanylate cyclase (GGDEF)-like protein